MIRLGWRTNISLRAYLGSTITRPSVPLYKVNGLTSSTQLYEKYNCFIPIKILKRTSSSTTVPPNQGRKNGYYEKASWFISAEWKILTSVLVAVLSYHLNERLQRIQLKQEMKLSRIQQQAVMGHHGALKRYLEEARQKKDAEMLWRWRSYVWSVLYPLDKAAVEMICNNAHLIIDGKFPEEFEQLLIHTAKLEFAMEHWKSPNGKLEAPKDFTDEDFSEENNSSGVRQRNQLLVHVKEKYDVLRDDRRRVSLEINSGRRADGILSSIFNRAMS